MTKKKRNKICSQPKLLSLDTLKALIRKSDTGLLFCFGNSFISRVIQAKTKEYDDELVPSHVAMIVNGQFLYESTSAPERLGNKRIPSGVRRYLIKDFYKLEKGKEAEYYFYPCNLLNLQLEKYLFYPYGKDTIIDFLLKDGSDGDSKGLICSQYANICSDILKDEPCPTPADLFRAIR
jgi:hypothetical protein|nr:MAG TPA: hypothetical protein [Caudoviricetes sp.]